MDLSPTQTFLVYLPYGAVFFAIGIAITSRRKVFANLKISGLFWLLAIFAFIHALLEWVEMYRHLQLAGPAQWLIPIRHVSLLLALISFVFLFLFGISLNASLVKKSGLWLRGVFVVILIIFSAHLLQLSPWKDPQLLRTIEYDLRLLIALPATLLTAAGFFLYARQLAQQGLRGAFNFVGAGAGFVAYGICAGAIPSGTVLIVPIEVWRATSAFIILHFLMYALDTYMDQREEMISERLQLAANSEKLSAIGRLAAGIAHEINNPLANASLQLELLQHHPDAPLRSAKVSERLNTIEKSIDKSSHIARELLVFAGGRSPIAELSSVHLNEVIHSAWQLASCRTQNHQLQCKLTTMPTLQGHFLKLEELFLNLFINAIDAMPVGGFIHIHDRYDHDTLVVEVDDEGNGISEENQQRAMEPFFTTKEVGRGTGLGLSICFGIMELHGGTIHIKPRSNHQGTCVTLTFPAPADTRNTIHGDSNETDSGR